MDLKSFMNRAGLSQTQLAKKIGVTQAAISYWTSGTNTPSLDQAKKLLFLGMTLGELFDHETEVLLSKGLKVNKKKIAADVVTTALASLVNNQTDKITDKKTCTEIVKIGLEELFQQKTR